MSCAVEEDAEDDVKDDGAACHDHHRVGVDLEVVSHDSADGEEEKDAGDVPNLKIDVHHQKSGTYCGWQWQVEKIDCQAIRWLSVNEPSRSSPKYLDDTSVSEWRLGKKS